MKKILFSILLLFSYSFVESQVLIEKIYGDTNRIYASVNALPYKNGYILLSRVRIGSSGITKTEISRTDQAGAIQWTSLVDSVFTINMMIRNDRIIILQRQTLPGIYPHIYISEFDSSGFNSSNTVVDPYPFYVDTFSVTSTAFCSSADGGFLFTGYRDSTYYYRRFVLKTDSLFQYQWIFEDDLGSAQSNIGNIIETSTGDIVVFSRLSEGGASTPYSGLLKLNGNGQFSWKQYLYDCGANSLFENNQHEYVVAGSRADPMSGPPPPYHGYVFRLDTAGVIVWSDNLITERFHSVCKGAENEIVILGDEQIASGIYRLFLLAYDSIGNFLFKRYFRSDVSSFAGAVNICPDSSFVISATSDTTNNGNLNVEDFYLIVTNKPQSILAETETVSKSDILLYPNPTAGLINLGPNVFENEVQIFDSNGKQLDNFKVHSKNLSIDFNHFTPGIYLVRIIDLKTGNIYSQKIIKE